MSITVAAKSPTEAIQHFGWIAPFVGLDAPTSSEKTRARLGWQPEQPDLLADLDHPAYFPS